MFDIYKNIINKKRDNQFLVGTVYSVDPLTVTLIPSDTAIPIIATNCLLGIKVGSRVVLLKFGNQLIAVAIIQDNPYPIGSGKYVRKDSETSRTSTTESDDPHLTITIPRNGIYRVEGIYFIDGDDDGTDFKFQYTNSNLTLKTYRTAIGAGTSSTSNTNGTLNFNSKNFTQDGQIGIVSGGWTGVLDIFYVETDSSDGVCTLRWACLNSSSTITLKNGSSLSWQKLENN